MVSQKEIIEALTFGIGNACDRIDLANRIESEGIAPPDGYAIVPIEPTDMMKAAGNDAFPITPFEITCGELSGILYKAMLAAAEIGRTK